MKKLALLLPTIAFLVLLELMLRGFHHTLPLGVSSYIASAYHIGPGGIYQYSPENHMYIMKPNFEREMYFSGYRWHHKTDSSGFRNPVDRHHADIVLIGDSMIYGHGVEETDTVRSHLEHLTGRSVINMGIQGGSIHTEYQVFKNSGVEFSPQFAFLFFTVNDIVDLEHQLTREQMERLVSLEPGAVEDNYFDPRPLPIWRRILATFEGIYVARALFAAGQVLSRRLITAAQANPVPVEPGLSLELQFHLKALTLINEIAKNNGIHLVQVFIATANPAVEGLESTYKLILEQHTRREGIPFVDLGNHFAADPQARQALFLSDDGHFSPAGARWVAHVLATYISTHQP